MRAVWLVVTSLVIFTLVAFLGFRYAAGPVRTKDADVGPVVNDPVTQRIVLPHDEPELPPGPGRTDFITHCEICHSPRYVMMQPLFPRKIWKSEVHKMVTAYKAPLEPADEAGIVNYLVSIHGEEDANK